MVSTNLINAVNTQERSNFFKVVAWTCKMGQKDKEYFSVEKEINWQPWSAVDCLLKTTSKTHNIFALNKSFCLSNA